MGRGDDDADEETIGVTRLEFGRLDDHLTYKIPKLYFKKK